MELDYTKAQRLLARRDPVLRDLMRTHGPCRLAARQHADPFKALIRAIVGQQLSTKAAATIFSRFEGLFDAFPTPVQVLAMPDERLRAGGLSTQKVGYLRDLCLRIAQGDLPLDDLDRMDDETVIEALTRVKMCDQAITGGAVVPGSGLQIADVRLQIRVCDVADSTAAREACGTCQYPLSAAAFRP